MKKIGATGASSAHLKYDARHHENMKLLQEVLVKYGRNGEALIRFEWLRWKRILQPQHGRRPWANKRMHDKKFLQTIYRENDVLDHWGEIVEREQIARPVQAVAP